MSCPIQISTEGREIGTAVDTVISEIPGVFTRTLEPATMRLHIYCDKQSSHRAARERSAALGVPVVQVYNFAENAFLASWNEGLYVDWSTAGQKSVYDILARIVELFLYAKRRGWV